MRIISRFMSSVALATTVVMAGAAIPASSLPLEFGSDYFEYISDPGISWADAKTAAASLSYLGATGYLATVTSAAENNFLSSNFTISNSFFEGAWLGGQVSSAGGGYWMVGPDAGQQFSQFSSPVLGAYANWGGIEPNNAPSAAYMNIGAAYAGINNGQWADAGRGGLAGPGDPIQGYFVEFNATPLPSTWLMLLSGFLGLGFLAYRGTKKRSALAAA